MELFLNDADDVDDGLLVLVLNEALDNKELVVARGLGVHANDELDIPGTE
jgi:hypothetical protein